MLSSNKVCKEKANQTLRKNYRNNEDKKKHIYIYIHKYVIEKSDKAKGYLKN